MVDRLGVIARWWLVMDSHDAPYSVRSTRGSAEKYARDLNAECTVREVVPAEQLQGAVESLAAADRASAILSEQLRTAVEALDLISRQSGDPIARQIARVALRRPANEPTGGQS